MYYLKRIYILYFTSITFLLSVHFILELMNNRNQYLFPGVSEKLFSLNLSVTLIFTFTLFWIQRVSFKALVNKRGTRFLKHCTNLWIHITVVFNIFKFSNTYNALFLEKRVFWKFKSVRICQEFLMEYV